MTVKELIEYLSKLNPDAEVVVSSPDDFYSCIFEVDYDKSDKNIVVIDVFL